MNKQVLNFDGTDDYALVQDFQWSTSRPITVEFWCKVNADQVQRSLAFALGNQTPGAQRFQANVPWYDRGVDFDYADDWIGADYTQHLGKWTHVAFVYEGKNGFKRIYFDGKEVYSKETNTGLEENLTLQRLYIVGGAPYYTDNLFHRGLVAEFRVWDEALSTVKINAHKNRQRMGDERALSGYWKMDDGSGMVLRDSKAGNPRPATIHGAAWTVVNDLPVGPEYGLSGYLEKFSAAAHITDYQLQSMSVSTIDDVSEVPESVN